MQRSFKCAADYLVGEFVALNDSLTVAATITLVVPTADAASLSLTRGVVVVATTPAAGDLETIVDPAVSHPHTLPFVG